jgi:type I restriction enzyme S subunit
MSTTSEYCPSPIKTRLSENEPVPKRWQWVDLENVARLESGHTPSRKVPEYWEAGDVPWLSLKDIRGMTSRYVTDTIDKPTMLGIDNSSARMLPKGTVALCRTASVGKVAILGRDMATSQDFVNWVCGSELLPEYLFEAFKASSATFETEKQGSTHQTIYMPTVKRFKILLPPLPEQKRIADILDKADAIRRKRQEAAKQCNDFLTSVFNTLFGDPVLNPNKWPETTLDEVAHLQSGVTKGRNFGDQQTIDVPYMRVWNVQDGHLRLDDIKDITVLPSDIQRYSLEEGDLLLTEGGDPDQLGRGAIWYAPIPVCIHQNHIFRVRCNQKVVIPEFLSALIGSQKGKRYFLKMAKQTTGIASINMTQLKKCPVFLPPLHLQQQFAKLDRQFEKTCETLNTRFDAVDQLFGSLAQKAFRGDL